VRIRLKPGGGAGTHRRCTGTKRATLATTAIGSWIRGALLPNAVKGVIVQIPIDTCGGDNVTRPRATCRSSTATTHAPERTCANRPCNTFVTLLQKDPVLLSEWPCSGITGSPQKMSHRELGGRRVMEGFHTHRPRLGGEFGVGVQKKTRMP
jgi:hypothetical protein